MAKEHTTKRCEQMLLGCIKNHHNCGDYKNVHKPKVTVCTWKKFECRFAMMLGMAGFFSTLQTRTLLLLNYFQSSTIKWSYVDCFFLDQTQIRCECACAGVYLSECTISILRWWFLFCLRCTTVVMHLNFETVLRFRLLWDMCFGSVYDCLIHNHKEKILWPTIAAHAKPKRMAHPKPKQIKWHPAKPSFSHRLQVIWIYWPDENKHSKKMTSGKESLCQLQVL